MAAFGTLTLLIAFVVATYAGVASLIGIRRNSQRLIESGRAASYALAAVLALSSVTIVYAFLTHDFSIKYVQHTSSVQTPLIYQITAYWGGLDGSIMWWVFLLSVFGAIAIYTNRNRHKEILPYVVVTLMAIADFFLFLIIFHKNPFDTFLTERPTTGEGLNPLLQNAYMATHPPSLYTGFVGMSIPYAFAMGTLISGHLDDAWIAAVRRWTLIAWFFLSMGLTLGMIWAYEELGWGGFWAWDPVENAAAVPWFTATAFFHSTMIQERRGMMKIWNFTLIILTFLLTIVGTFLTRSGVVQSVHAFGEDKKLAMMFIVFMIIVLVVSASFLIRRLPELKSRAKLESPLSREAAFLVNNWALLVSAFFVLFGTLFPHISEHISGQKITVGPPFFNKYMVPIGLVLLFLTGIGPLIAWRKASGSHLKFQFTWPAIISAVTLAICLVLKLHDPSVAPVICFAFCAFTATAVVQEFVRGAMVRKKNTGSDAFTALLGMILRGRRRYGGYIVHLGIVCMFLGFAGQSFKTDEEVKVKEGEVKHFGRYDLRFNRLRHEEDRQKEMLTGDFTVLLNGKEIDQMHPARWFYNGPKKEMTTEVAIRRSLAEDLYVTMGDVDFSDRTGSFKLVVNPIVDWVWLGFMLLAIGTGIALLPELALGPVAARVSAGEAAAARAGGATLAILLAVGVLLGSGRAEAAVNPEYVRREAAWFGQNLRCMCGMGSAGCGHMLQDCGAECGAAPAFRKQIAGMLEQGQTREQIIQHFVQEYGGLHVLGAPPDKGINRLAWAVPYGLGLAGAGVLGLTAWKLSKRSRAQAPPEAGPPKDTDLEDRLDDELSRVDS